MNLLLAIHSYPDANSGVTRHFPYYEKSGAQKILGIGTTDGRCRWPSGVESVEIGANSYIGGSHLPRRLMDTMRLMLLMPFDRFCIIEWDCLFFQPLPEFSGMAAFHAGGRHGDMKAERFYHVPWAFDFESGTVFLKKADELIGQVSGNECSPDVFFGWICEQAGLPVTQPWEQFTKNTISEDADIQAARRAIGNGATCVHGIKSHSVFDRVMS